MPRGICFVLLRNDALCFRRFVDIGMQPCLKMNGIHFPGFEFGHVREVYGVDLFHLRYYLGS